MAIIIPLPDRGENVSEVILSLPSGERVELNYNAHYGTLDVCMYERQDGSDAHSPGAPEFKSKECLVTNWTDERDAQGHYVSAMHPAPAQDRREHIRYATQLVISVGPNHEE
jgi:hypothetical protein